MNPEVLKVLKGGGLLSDHRLNLGFVDSGSYALNRIMSGKYDGGYPIGGIIELIGNSSTGKTGFLTHLFREAQKKGYITGLIDNEFAYSEPFAETLGVDGTQLYYPPLEEIDNASKAFATMKKFILEVRKVDKETPIVLGFDSMGTLQGTTESESDIEKSSNMDGAIRAKEIAGLLRKFNPLVRQHKVCLVFINQYRVNPGVMYGDPRTRAGGGNSLEYYCGLSNEISTSKTNGTILDDKKTPIGFQGVIRNKKNKVSIPYMECEFRFSFSTGLERFYGLTPLLEKDGYLTRNGAWYTVNNTGLKYQQKDFENLLGSDPGMQPIRDLLGLDLDKEKILP